MFNISNRRRLKGHPFWVRHKQNWKQGSIPSLSDTAILPGSDSYRKPSDRPLCVYQLSSLPPSVERQLLSMLADRLSSLSCIREEFVRAVPECGGLCGEVDVPVGCSASPRPAPIRGNPEGEMWCGLAHPSASM